MSLSPFTTVERNISCVLNTLPEHAAVAAARGHAVQRAITSPLPANRTVWQTKSSAIAVIADRTACSILTLFIVTATSRPLNKKIRLLSVRESNTYCGSASAIRSLQFALLSAPALVGGRTAW